MTEPASPSEETAAAEVPPLREQPEPVAEVPDDADPRVGAAVRRLDELADLPLVEHVEIYESVHQSLQESLAEAAGDAVDPDHHLPSASP